MIKRLCDGSFTYPRAMLGALAVIPLAFLTGIVAGFGHAPKILFIPFLLLFGPLVIVGLRFEKEPLFYFLGPFLLYTFYGLALVYLSRKSVKQCRAFTMALIALHIVATVGSLLFSYIKN